MATGTHERALSWAADKLGAEDVGRGASYHLRAKDGCRIRVAGRHIKGRQPNFFHLGPTLDGSPFASAWLEITRLVAADPRPSADQESLL